MVNFDVTYCYSITRWKPYHKPLNAQLATKRLSGQCLLEFRGAQRSMRRRCHVISVGHALELELLHYHIGLKKRASGFHRKPMFVDSIASNPSSVIVAARS